MTDPYRERPLMLDDPRIPPLQERIHVARQHDWQPACGSCFSNAYGYLETADILGTTPPDKVLVDKGGSGTRDDPYETAGPGVIQTLRWLEHAMEYAAFRSERLPAAYSNEMREIKQRIEQALAPYQFHLDKGTNQEDPS